MPELHIYTDIEKDFNLDHARMVATGMLTGIGLLRHGTASGAAVVSMVIELADGGQVFAQATWATFHVAARALAASPIASEEVTFD